MLVWESKSVGHLCEQLKKCLLIIQNPFKSDIGKTIRLFIFLPIYSTVFVTHALVSLHFLPTFEVPNTDT